eukprot:scaffold264952_cov24-Prasinocladus_malaysianus.AAC.1
MAYQKQDEKARSGLACLQIEPCGCDRLIQSLGSLISQSAAPIPTSPSALQFVSQLPYPVPPPLRCTPALRIHLNRTLLV